MSETPTSKPAAQPRKPGIPPPAPDTSEKWSFREIRATREKIVAAINDARLTDPQTRKPGDVPLPDVVKNYLLWIVGNLEGDVFVMDGHVHAASKSEWLEHLHIKKFC